MSEQTPPIKTLREVAAGDLPMFPAGEARGALPNGTRVRKIRDDPGDTHTLGDQAVVIASHGPRYSEYLYFVVWDDLPDIPVGIQSSKLARL
jgi:hypothetical protein